MIIETNDLFVNINIIIMYVLFTVYNERKREFKRA